jgi:hypothetical protein
MIGVVANTTMQKNTLISVHVCFSALLPTTEIIFLQRGKMIGVAHTAEKLSALLTTMQKNV